MTRSVRTRRSPFFALLLCASVLVGSSPALAQPSASAPAAHEQDLIAKGQRLFDDQEYEESIVSLSAALVRPNNTKAQKIEIYRLLALNYITLGRTAEAHSAVRGLLAVEPGYALPATESPRFRDFFAEARERWEAEGRPGFVEEAPEVLPVGVRHQAPSTAEQGKPVELRGTLDDPGARASRATLYFRSGTRGEFDVRPAEIDGKSLRAHIPGASVKPPVIDYYFEIMDGEGAVIASRGDAQGPLRIAVPEPKGGGGWVLPVAIGGGLVGAAAIVGGLALAGVFKSSPPPARSTVTINIGEAGLGW